MGHARHAPSVSRLMRVSGSTVCRKGHASCGRYGRPYSSTSINNPYSTYGCPYSSQSPNNPYATQAPLLFGD